MDDYLIRQMEQALNQGQWAQAEATCRSLIRTAPDYLPAFYNLAVTLAKQGRLHDAFYCFAYCSQHVPVAAKGQRDGFLLNMSKVSLALRASGKAVVGSADAALQQAQVCIQQQQWFEAVAAVDVAIAAQPDRIEAYACRAACYRMANRREEALVTLDFALAKWPDQVEMLHALLQVLLTMGNSRLLREWMQHLQALGDASRTSLALQLDVLGKTQCYRQMLAVLDDSRANGGWSPQTFAIRRADVLCSLGRLAEAVRELEALGLDALLAAGASIYGNYLFYLVFTDIHPLAYVYEQHRKVGAWLEQKSGVPLVALSEQRARRTGKLRIGFVSPDFKAHPVANFLLPLWRHLDSEQFEIHAYHLFALSDFVTSELKTLADHWQDAHGWDEQRLARQIIADGIDILVDTTGYTAGGVMGLFAMKPAPVQVAWMGYPHTTGLSRMDFRISDVHADPVGMTEAYSSEQIWRLPDGYYCYEPFARFQLQPCQQMPCQQTGQITLGCLNRYDKVSDGVVVLWARILREVSNARLLLSVGGNDVADSQWQQAEVLERFARVGIAPKQIAFISRVMPHEYYRLYEQMDVMLDTFPFNGGTTTCDALFMGVPVITLAGGNFPSRMGVSILNQVHLPDLVAQTEEEYVALAVRACVDREWLHSLRDGLSEHFRASPMMDAPRFARNMGAAFQGMWGQSVKSFRGENGHA